MKNDAVIYDFETLSQDASKCVVVSCAMTTFSLEGLAEGYYTFDKLVKQIQNIKFKVQEQVEEYNLEIDPETLEWWSEQTKEARALIKPSSEDVSIDRMIHWFNSQVELNDVRIVYTRNNTFDPIILKNICEITNHKFPYPWWMIRDTKSTIDGLTWHHDIKDSFIPPNCEGYVKHNPAHDIALDIMRLQTLVQATK